MKCKRIFKVVSALALTVALIVSTGVVSFAATYTTTTTYLSQDTIQVTSVASGLEKGDMATYVAYNGDEGFSDTSAVYIDQATAKADENGKVEDVIFTYQTKSDNVNATVKFGGSKVETAQDPDIKNWSVCVVVYQGDSCTPDTVIVPKKDENYSGDYLAREFEVSLAAGYAVSEVEVDGVKTDAWGARNGVVTVLDKQISEDSVVTIYAEKVEDSNVSITLGTVTGGKNKITAFGKAVCSDEIEVGILIDKDEINAENVVKWDNADSYDNTVKLAALGRGTNGGFCVEVEDDLLTAGNYKVAAYAGTQVSDEVKSVNVTAE